MYYKKLNNIVGFKFKSNYRPLRLKRAKKRIKRVLFSKKEAAPVGPEVIASFSELIKGVSPELASEVLEKGLPKQIFIGPYLFDVLRPIFQEYPIRIVKHRYLANRDVKLSWEENQFVPIKIINK